MSWRCCRPLPAFGYMLMADPLRALTKAAASFPGRASGVGGLGSRRAQPVALGSP